MMFFLYDHLYSYGLKTADPPDPKYFFDKLSSVDSWCSPTTKNGGGEVGAGCEAGHNFLSFLCKNVQKEELFLFCLSYDVVFFRKLFLHIFAHLASFKHCSALKRIHPGNI